MHTNQPIYLVSACLTGLCSRYDGQTKPSTDCLILLRGTIFLPICPEQLGGLATPREAANIVGGDGNDVLAGRARVITRSGKDCTREFVLGAHQVLKIAQMQNITFACLKARSPSCAVHTTIGVTAALLQQHGVELLEF